MYRNFKFICFMIWGVGVLREDIIGVSICYEIVRSIGCFGIVILVGMDCLMVS